MSSKAQTKEFRRIYQLLGEISESLNEIHDKIRFFSDGQRNDRIATIHAGLLQFQQARKAANEEIRNKLLSGAVNLLNQGRALLIEDLHQTLAWGRREKRFSDKIWSLFGIDKKFIDYLRYLKARSQEIGQAMIYINAASSALIEAYYVLDEVGPASSVIYELLEYFEKLDAGLFRYKDILMETPGLKDIMPVLTERYVEEKDKARAFLVESEMIFPQRSVPGQNLMVSKQSYTSQEFWVVLYENTSRSIAQFNGLLRNNFHIVQMLALVGIAFNFRLIAGWIWKVIRSMLKEMIRERLRLR